MKIYLQGKVLFGFLVSIVMIVSLAFISFLFFNEFLETASWGSHARKVLYLVEKLKASTQQIRLEILTAQPSEGSQTTGPDNGLSEFQKTLVTLDSLTRDNESQQERIHELEKIFQSGIEGSPPVIANRLRHSADSNRLNFNAYVERISSMITAIENNENELVQTRSIKASRQFHQFAWTFFGLVVSTIILLAVMVHSINTNLQFRVKSEAQLQKAKQETQRVNTELESFSYSVSHDLRAPLRSIDGYAQILQEDYGDKLDEEGNRVISIIIRNAERMGQLIDDLLNFSRASRTELSKSQVDLNMLVEPIARELLHLEKERTISLDIKPLGYATIDANLFRQVWINLLSNAIKYTSKRPDAKIEVGVTSQANDSVYYVRDNGAGFNMAYSSKLFGVFQRLHKSSEFEGTGVGLALVKRIIERHDGRIWADSTEGSGSVFYFQIPNS